MTKPPIAYSCVRCFDRKVKCSKEYPSCEACMKHGQSCEYRVPAKPQRRKKRVQDEVLNQKLKQYEQLLAQNGIDVPSLNHEQSHGVQSETCISNEPSALEDVKTPATDATSGSTRQFVASQLVFNEQKSQYLENLWTRVTEELSSPQDALADSSDDDEDDENEYPDGNDKCAVTDDNMDFFLGVTSPSTAVRTSHPSAYHIMALWQIFLDNVHPLCMIVHRPTLHKTLQKATTHLDKLPKNLEVLMFSIYAAAVVSSTEAECQSQFDESRRTLLIRYRDATKVALSRAKFLCTQDLVVLQGLVIHLMTTRDMYHSRTLWTLTGVATRIAEGMGLHRDGSALGLPHFEAEIRRRIWWQLLIFDFRSAELSGSNKFKDVGRLLNGSNKPANIDEDDIFPGMTYPPQSREGATDMIFCSLRYEFGSYWGRKLSEDPNKDFAKLNLWGNYESVKEMAEKDKNIEELEAILEHKYLRYCDPTVPAQFMTLLVGRFGPGVARLIVHHPRRYASDADVPESEKALLLSISLKHLEMFSMIAADRKLRRFSWHTGFYFQWQAYIHLLDCLLNDPRMPESGRAWALIQEIYEHTPDLFTNTTKPVNMAVGALCVKAYFAREQAFIEDGTPFPKVTPPVIVILRQQRDAAAAKRRRREQRHRSEPHPKQDQGIPQMDVQIQNQPQMMPWQDSLTMPNQLWYEDLGFQQSNAMDFENVIAQDLALNDTQMDWSQWDRLLKELG